jgi:HD-GYP domain-containing protein (c-di-GMP phosphodiesterase class II)
MMRKLIDPVSGMEMPEMLQPVSVTAVASAADDRLKVLHLEEQLARLRAGTVFALNEMLDLKDIYTGLHSSRLAEWAVRLGEKLRMNDADQTDLETSAILHDIGKNGVAESILSKPGKLDPEERAQIEKHSEYGWAILRVIPGFEKSALLVLHHHERLDGTGYPARLKAEEIPLGSKVISVIDSFDAMVSDRAYRKGLPLAEAIRRLHEGVGTQFDGNIVDLFVKIAASDSSEVSDSVFSRQKANS